jgi:hypothetical protein
MKIYQIKYSHYGIIKYSYTDDFIEYYNTYPDVKTKTNVIIEKKQFYEEMQKMWSDKKNQ